ncbi:MAG: methionyl-tRNA formyltransferase [Erysipelotrichaceae bacterium]|nr:methionyl-tRNA formyltransferase [Erysipelotrichaceae bacterium]
MGTPYFAQVVLRSLINEGYKIIAVVTQPDKPVGRKHQLEQSPVKELARQSQLPVFQPLKIREDYQFIIDINPDLIITCAYGQIIPSVIISNYLCINIHASLLPELRGGAPMHRAIMNGRQQTGITLMKMAKKMDDGDIIIQESVDITLEDTVSSLQEKLIDCACRMLEKNLPLIVEDRIPSHPQDHSLATFGYNISKDDEFISFQRPYMTVYNHIRALISWPIGYGIIKDQKIKLHGVCYSDLPTDEPDGTLIGLVDNQIQIAVEHRIIGITQLQVEGRNIVSATDFMNGLGKQLINQRFK